MLKKIIYTFIFTLCAFIHFNPCVASFTKNTKREINNIYIQGNGQNKFEAMIKANENGMRRAFAIIIDKMGFDSVHDIQIQNLNYKYLKSIFSIKSKSNEVSTEDFYSAIVDYEYTLGAIRQALRDHSTKAVLAKFYDYIVLPILKQKNKICMWDYNQIWLKPWYEKGAIKLLEQSNIYFPEKNALLQERINSQNILTMSYDDFVNIFSDELFNSVIVVVYEHFTDPISNDLIMSVKSNVLNYNNQKNLHERLYPLKNKSDIEIKSALAVQDFIKEYGSLSKFQDDIEQLSASIKDRKITFNIEVFDQSELDEIQHKLQKAPNIHSIQIKPIASNKYQLSIMTPLEEAALVEEMYLNSLSFKKYGNIYSLININQGI